MPTVFADSSRPDRLARALKRESHVDVRVLPLFSGFLTRQGGGAATYLEVMRANTTAIADGLGASTPTVRPTAGITLLLATSLAPTACGTDSTDEPAAEENRTSPAPRRSPWAPTAGSTSSTLRPTRSPGRSRSSTDSPTSSTPRATRRS